MYHLLIVVAMVLHDKIYNSLNNYFSLLSHTGYKSYSEVYKLLVLSFIEEMISGDIKEYLTEEDYKYISSAMECLYGSCIIPYPDKTILTPYMCCY